MCGFIKHGFYKRWAIGILGKAIRVRIQRYLCKNKKCKGKKKTFSYLPEDLIPYRVYSLEIIINFLESLLETSGVTQEQMVERIVNNYEADSALEDLSFVQLKDFMKMMKATMHKFTSLTKQTFKNLPEFFRYCQNYKFQDRIGFLAIKQFIYCQHQQFLFGTASQFRTQA